MILKTNLHLHTNDDPEDALPHSFTDVLDLAAQYGFGCIALTCHNKYIDYPEYQKAAEVRGVLFVPGVERTIEKCHVVVLNSDKEIEKVRTFKEFRAYKATHPEIFVIAPHPYFPGGYSLQRNLLKHKDLFDAIEHSWFYSRHINLNKKAERVAHELGLPFIATSDMHDLKYLNTNYAEIEVAERTIPALFDAIRKNRFTNVTSPRKLFREMALTYLKAFTSTALRRPQNLWARLKKIVNF